MSRTPENIKEFFTSPLPAATLDEVLDEPTTLPPPAAKRRSPLNLPDLIFIVGGELHSRIALAETLQSSDFSIVFHSFEEPMLEAYAALHADKLSSRETPWDLMQSDGYKDFAHAIEPVFPTERCVEAWTAQLRELYSFGSPCVVCIDSTPERLSILPLARNVNALTVTLGAVPKVAFGQVLAITEGSTYLSMVEAISTAVSIFHPKE